jgi:threonylcarbamoyladenosine tRNA methylthiotransferase MtaB
LGDVRAAVAAGFGEIVLTGIDIAGYMAKGRGQKAEIVFLSDLCKQLLNDVQGIRRLRLSSMDPASPEIPKLIELMARDSRMMPRFHLSMQSGSDTILAAMKRRHTADIVRHVIRHSSFVTFSWDLICGFPGETEELFNDTCDLIRELAPIKLHVFPYSKRPGTLAAGMPGQVDKAISKQRVRIAQKLAFDNLHEFMKTKVGTVAQVLMEENNIARTPDDIGVIMRGAALPDRMICDVKLIDIDGENFVGEVL